MIGGKTVRELVIGTVSSLIAAGLLAVVAWKWASARVWLLQPLMVPRIGLVLLIFLAATGVWTFLRRQRSESLDSSSLVSVPAMITGSSEPAPAPKQQETPTSRTEGGPYESMERYFATRDAMSGRFAELEEFDKRLIGQQVRWEGIVRFVSSYNDATVSLIIYRSDREKVDTAYVRFPQTFSKRLFALTHGDRVCITGKVSAAGGSGVSVEGESFEVLLPGTRS